MLVLCANNLDSQDMVNDQYNNVHIVNVCMHIFIDIPGLL